MAKPVGQTKGLAIYGPYPPGNGSKVDPKHLMLRIVGKGIDKNVFCDDDNIEPAIDVVRAELLKRLAVRRRLRQRMLAKPTKP